MVVQQQSKFKLLLDIMINYRFKKVIVYFPTCTSVTHFYSMFNYLLSKSDRLEKDELKVFSLHGKLNAKPRLKTLENFSTSTSSKCVLFTTDVAARGLDIPDVDLVLQLDPPTDPDMFPHRCGRTGRANKVGRAITFLSEGREEDFVDFMEVRDISLKQLDAPVLKDEFSKWYDVTTREWILQDRTRYDQSIRSYVAFVRYYSKHSAGSIFRLQSLDYKALCEMYCLTRIPKMPENKYIEDFPKDGWLNFSIDFDKYAYKDKKKEEARLHELKTEERKRERIEKSKKKKELAKKNSAWSSKTEHKDVKTERREKLKRRRDAVEAKIKEAQEQDDDDDSSSSEAEVDWKDLVRANKKKKSSPESNGFFDDL
ncbi:unnamed protein product [Ambrosiozyma monospora]|uniref:ATP-dependent RNA helicase n=1 Tax=Ambrosiozyma monospora TaxID=43982 RepID=A0A9W7DJ19_AMBMO|nr:unnamed protein product [Ambrosiozyma monospora]